MRVESLSVVVRLRHNRPFATISRWRKEYGYSVFSTVCNIEFQGKKLNIIDCAGADDFCGGTMAALQMVGSALIVLTADKGVEAGTENSFRLVEKLHKPLAFVINKCDAPDADFDNAFSQLREEFGNKCTLIQYPCQCGRRLQRRYRCTERQDARVGA